MAEERVDSRETTWRQLLPWTELFRAFQVALDLNKLLLAAVGIAVMAGGWWLLAVGFTANEKALPPDWPGAYEQTNDGWAVFRKDRMNWNLLNETAGLSPAAVYQVQDIAETPDEFETFKPLNEVQDRDLRQAFLDLVTAIAAKDT